MERNQTTSAKVNIHSSRRLSLMMYDAILLIITELLILGVYPSSTVELEIGTFLTYTLILFVCLFLCRYYAGIYKLIWRYVKSAAFIRLVIADSIAGLIYYVISMILPISRITFIHSFSVVALNLLLTICIRLVYQYLYERAQKENDFSGIVWKVVKLITGLSFEKSETENSFDAKKIRIAIVGAGHVGVMLADELLNSTHSPYQPCCFIDIDESKVGREIFDIPVLSDKDATTERLAMYGIQEIVFALPTISSEHNKKLYEHYKKTGCKIKLYDYPVMQTTDKGKRNLREFDIEDLLFRKEIEFHDESTKEYYKDKVVLITGGGGSIGSELCRQIANMNPRKLVILDICENGAYDIEQELKIVYGGKINVAVEIVSVCDYAGLEKVFAEYRPDIVLHAAAHKHVPLMEHNTCEAIKNNVFGTLNTVELSEKHKVGRFIMISTDKAVNPTNVMGATKRMCEMLVQSYSQKSTSTVYSATRFGNVLGSNGSVVPLFKKQIMNGGPITLTDKRIIRYFMTIPEASQLVLESGRLAKNGEIFVLDMGKPIKILELAESMIRLSGYEPYRDIDIIETGLRPGEKLYEELLVRPDELIKTENDLIFIEQCTPLPIEEINEKLLKLKKAVALGDEEVARAALIITVPTFVMPE